VKKNGVREGANFSTNQPEKRKVLVKGENYGDSKSERKRTPMHGVWERKCRLDPQWWR